MAKSINQEKLFSSSPNDLYKFYMDEQTHAAITGKKAKIGTKAGENFSAFDGEIKGKILYIIRNKLIVQTWRYKTWEKTALDSVVTLTFIEKEGGSTAVSLSHSNIPDEHLDAVKKGWTDSYWNAWKKYITNPPVKAAKAAKTTKTTKTTKTAKKGKTTGTKKTTKSGGTKQQKAKENITIS